MGAEPLWIFGYGSLIWRPDIPFDRSHPAVLGGWARRFWQGSTDHRGVPGAPGRVVTLVREPRARVVGRAFRVPSTQRREVLARLDHREQGGYERHEVQLQAWPDGRPLARALVYLAGVSNPEWLGPAPVDAMAEHIASSRGPSGTNREYLVRLWEALDGLGAVDPHVKALAERVMAVPERAQRL